MIELKQHEEGYYTITPNFAVRATDEETKNVVFGSDIYGNGAVITRTFKSDDFQINENILKITCSDIIEDMSDIPDEKRVWFLVRNDKTRAGVIRGIRVLAVYEKRINPSVLRVEDKK